MAFPDETSGENRTERIMETSHRQENEIMEFTVPNTTDVAEREHNANNVRVCC